MERETPLTRIEAQAMKAYLADRASITDNPYEHGSQEWWMWRLSFLKEQEIEEWDQSIPAQVERAVEEQPQWERRERLGVHDLVKRVQRRADELARWLGMAAVPSVLLNAYGREPLREAVEELCAIEPERR